MLGRRYASIVKLITVIMSVFLLTGCSADDISNIIGDAIGEMVDTTVDGLIDQATDNLNGTNVGGTGSTGPGDEHWASPTPTPIPDDGSQMNN